MFIFNTAGRVSAEHRECDHHPKCAIQKAGGAISNEGTLAVGHTKFIKNTGVRA
jgi:hypothetical protein